jgi:hypothetical protein
LLPMKVKRDDPLPTPPSGEKNGFSSWWTANSDLTGGSSSREK